MKRFYYRRFERLESRTLLAAHGDFNGDGFDDLAVGIPKENVGAATSAGAVQIIYGSSGRLTATGNQTWTFASPGVNGVAHNNEFFGRQLAAGDFNGDGFDDLAIGVVGKVVNGHNNAGAVSVLFGSQNGITATNDQLWTQDSPGINDSADGPDQFGSALAAGDFNNDGRDDLAIGVHNESTSVVACGAVNVIYGSSSGLSGSNDQFWTQDSSGINDKAELEDAFGNSLTAGDFNGDGRDDLAVGVNVEIVGAVSSAGAVNVIYGSASGLTASGDQFWSQDSDGILNSAEEDDRFGAALAAGDFNGDSFDDLAVGIRGENALQGAVAVIYGSAAKLTATGDELFTATSLGFTSTAAKFGAALTTGDFDGDGRDDLAIGAPEETVATKTNAGAVYVAYGSKSSGVAIAGAQHWTENTGTVRDFAEIDDFFGGSLISGDFDGDGHADLAIGVPQEKPASVDGAGAVIVLYGLSTGLVDTNNQLWDQSQLSTSDGNQIDDNFGSALA